MKKLSVLLIITLVLASVLAACQSGGLPFGAPTITATSAPSATLEPTATPQPLGSAGNPIIMGVVLPPPTGEITPDHPLVTLVTQLANATGLAFQPVSYPTYKEAVDALAQGKLHVAFLPPLTYLYAAQKGLAEAVLVANHFGVYAYGSQFLANKASLFRPYYDPITGEVTGDAATALSQFQDRRPCWVEPQSVAGMILPASVLKEGGIALLPAVITQSHTATVRALYIRGVCDFGATFSISGDPRTSSAVLEDLPDVMDRIQIIWQTPAIIPNLNISLAVGMPNDLRLKLIQAFTDVVKTDEGKTLLSHAIGDYQIDDLRQIDDTLYDPLRVYTNLMELDLTQTIGK